jgi:hypothetical protein
LNSAQASKLLSSYYHVFAFFSSFLNVFLRDVFLPSRHSNAGQFRPVTCHIEAFWVGVLVYPAAIFLFHADMSPG